MTATTTPWDLSQEELNQNEEDPQDGCEACGNPDAEYLIRYDVWITAYCESCAQQLVRDGHRLDSHSKPLPETDKPTETQLTLWRDDKSNADA